MHTFVRLMVLLQVILLFALAISRACNIWLCSRAVNLLRPPEMSVPDSHQVGLASGQEVVPSAAVV